MQAPMSDQTYNGWSNYATWGVALVLDNDEGTYPQVREMARDCRDAACEHPNVSGHIWDLEQAERFLFADQLKDYVESLCGLDDDLGVTEPTMMAKQVLQAGLADVDWQEIADNILGD
jgi:hypothetical protein